ncbi:hypothetical protein C3L33_01472, partial [Rhododendron williamsianum]
MRRTSVAGEMEMASQGSGHPIPREHVVRGSEVFVGGLVRNITESKIREGYCFVRFATKEAADKAVKEKSGITVKEANGLIKQILEFHGRTRFVEIEALWDPLEPFVFKVLKHEDWSADEFDKLVHQAFPDVVSIDLAMPFGSGDSAPGQKQQNRGFAIVKFSSHAAAARAHRLGSNSDFILAANCHPAVEWAKDEPDINPEELAKIKIAFVRNLPANADEDYLKKLFEPLGKLDRVVLSKKSRSPVGFVHFAERSLSLEELGADFKDGGFEVLPVFDEFPNEELGNDLEVVKEDVPIYDKFEEKYCVDNEEGTLVNMIKESFLMTRQDSKEDLDNAIKEMNGKTVQGPNGGPSIKLLVEVARPIEKNRKRALDDPQSKPASKMSSHSKISKDEQALTTFGGIKSGALELKYSLEEPVVVDPYEAAVISLPVAVKERLLRILRLGIATRFDINVESLTSLRDLPESTSITILDQFMLSGAERLNKGEYLSALISRYRVDKLGLNQHALSLARVGDIATKESPLSSISSRVHHSPIDTVGSRAGTTISESNLHLDFTGNICRYDIYTSRYSSPLSTYPLPSSRLSYGKMEESGQDPLLSSRVSYAKMEEDRRDPLFSRASYAKMEESGRDPLLSRASYAKIDESFPVPLHRTLGSSTSYGKIELESSLFSPAAASDRQPKRNQVRFDPFTGEPYKFDPFTGEPIVPDSLPRQLPHVRRFYTASSIAFNEPRALQGLVQNKEQFTQTSTSSNAYPVNVLEVNLSWTTMISGYVNASDSSEALKLFYKVWVEPDLAMDDFALSIALKACGLHLNEKHGEILHGYSVKTGFVNSVFVGSALLDMYMKTCRVWEGCRVFEEMPLRNVVSWTAIITGLVQRAAMLRLWESALWLALIRKDDDQRCGFMDHEVCPNEYTLAAIISACANTARMEWVNNCMLICGQFNSASTVFHGMSRRDIVSWSTIIAGYSQGGHGEEAFKYLSWMRKDGPKPNEFALASHRAMVRSSLINMYAKCGSIQEASRIFNWTENDDIVSWTAMVNGYAEHGHSKEAIDLFEKIPMVGLRPDSVTFIEYGINPSKEHYGCIIDLLCRAGQLSDAEHMITKQILLLDPNCAGTLITIANIYSAKGRWKEAADVRRLMRSKGVIKEPGWSWIKIKDQVSAFVAGDRLHPEWEDIYAILHLLASREAIQEMGSLEYDVDDLQKFEFSFPILRPLI